MNPEIKRRLESALAGDEECLPGLVNLIQRHYPASTPQKLWETDHSYYCAVGSPKERASFYESWDVFLHGDTGSPLTPTGSKECPDLNLVFRWDWRTNENHGFVHDLKEGESELQLCYLTQRKGQYRTSFIVVTKEDEPAVRSWLQERYVHMLELWEPFFPDKDYKPWVPFFWDSNEYKGAMNTPGDWAKCRTALQDRWDYQTTGSIMGAMMCPTGPTDIPSFGYRGEHVGGVTLAAWSKENGMYERLTKTDDD